MVSHSIGKFETWRKKEKLCHASGMITEEVSSVVPDFVHDFHETSEISQAGP
jgi:hypothetical protein